MDSLLRCVSPVDGSVLVERPWLSASAIETGLQQAEAASRAWAATPIAERAKACRAFVDRVIADAEAGAEELAKQMGRPVAYGQGEFRGFAERARKMIDLADEALADYVIATPAPGKRLIRKEPLGVVLIIAPWNYPYLTAVNGIIPALMAGNAVILKHSHQTPLVAERLAKAAEQAGGFPSGLFQFMHIDRAQTLALIKDARIAGVAFTGSVAGGNEVETAAAGRFIPVGLELGGKDPGYVRADADIKAAVENLVDGSFFNSGQSCCGIERIYVDASIYKDFIDRFCALTRDYVLGNPLDKKTTLGPMVRASAVQFVRDQIGEAVDKGAATLIDESGFAKFGRDTAYLAPQIVINVDHSMRLMTEETFGPVVGIMSVKNDDEAIALMNDSAYGLTASLWTRDKKAAFAIGAQVRTGTVFLNRCDYLDPDLAWTGVKHSGRGYSLSPFGYGQLTRLKSYNFGKAV